MTICTENRRPPFGHIAGGEMHLSVAGRIARNEWVHTGSVRRDTVRLDAFGVMPDHVHLSFEIAPSATPDGTAAHSGGVGA